MLRFSHEPRLTPPSAMHSTVIKLTHLLRVLSEPPTSVVRGNEPKWQAGDVIPSHSPNETKSHFFVLLHVDSQGHTISFKTTDNENGPFVGDQENVVYLASGPEGYELSQQNVGSGKPRSSRFSSLTLGYCVHTDKVYFTTIAMEGKIADDEFS